MRAFVAVLLAVLIVACDTKGSEILGKWRTKDQVVNLTGIYSNFVVFDFREDGTVVVNIYARGHTFDQRGFLIDSETERYSLVDDVLTIGNKRWRILIRGAVMARRSADDEIDQLYRP